MRISIRILISLVLLSAAGQCQIPWWFGANKSPASQGYYLDSNCIDSAGSDSNSGTDAAHPWLTLTHANATMPGGFTKLNVKYPDGRYYSWAAAPAIFRTATTYLVAINPLNDNSSTTVCDVFNGHNATFTGTNIWWGAGRFILGPTNVDSYTTSANFSNFIGAGTNSTWITDVNTLSSGDVSSIVLAMIGGTSNYAEFSPPISGNVTLVRWSNSFGGAGFRQYSFSGDNNFHLYMNINSPSAYSDWDGNVQQGSTGAGAGTFSDPNDPLWIGAWPASPCNCYDPAMYFHSFMAINSDLSSGDRTALYNFLNGTENPRTTGVPALSPNGLAQTPTMAASLFDVYGTGTTQAEMEAQSDALVSTGLQSHGWDTMFNAPAWTTASRDGSNNLIVNTANFPNYTSMISHIHGNSQHAWHYLNPYAGCTGAGFGDVSFPYEFSNDAAQMVTFGFTDGDGLQYDACAGAPAKYLQAGNSTDYDNVEWFYWRMGTALRATGKNFQMQIAPSFGTTPPCRPYNVISWFQNAGGNYAYTSCDYGALSWAVISDQIDDQVGISSNFGPGHFPWVNGLAIGLTGVSTTEATTDFVFHVGWSAMLIVGCDLTDSTNCSNATNLGILGNDDLIAILKDSQGSMADRDSGGSCVGGNTSVWKKPMSNGDFFLMYLNCTAGTTSVAATWTGTYNLADLISKSNIGAQTNGYTESSVGTRETKAVVACHGSTNWDFTAHKCQ